MKALIDIIPIFSQKTEDVRAGAKTSSKPFWPPSGIRAHGSALRPTSTSTLQVARSTTMRSGYTMAISQAAFMQSSKVKERRYSPLLPQRMSRCESLQVPQPSYTPVERTEPVSPTQTNVAGRKYPRIPRTQASLVVATPQPTITRTN